MERLRNFCARLLCRVKGLFQCKRVESQTQTDLKAEAVAKVQEALQNGEQVQRVADFKMHRPTLRKTLHDMPAAQPNTYGKEKHWFNNARYDGRAGAASNTFNRLEAFLSSTDPDQLSALDPNWNKRLDDSANDDRPQPRKPTEDLPKIKRPQAEMDPHQKQLFKEGLLSESIS